VGCTHVRCDCGMLAKKPYYTCESCRRKNFLRLYDTLPKEEWSGEEPIFSHTLEKYFFDSDAIDEAIDDVLDDAGSEIELTERGLLLTNCRPIYFHTIDSSIYDGCLPEDDEDLPPEIEKAISTFNEMVSAYKKPGCWVPRYITAKTGEPGGTETKAIVLPWLQEWVEERKKHD